MIEEETPWLIQSPFGPSRDQLVTKIVFADPTISAIVIDPEENNLGPVSAFEQAGFAITKTVKVRDESSRRCIMRLSGVSASDVLVGFDRNWFDQV